MKQLCVIVCILQLRTVKMYMVSIKCAVRVVRASSTPKVCYLQSLAFWGSLRDCG